MNNIGVLENRETPRIPPLQHNYFYFAMFSNFSLMYTCFYILDSEEGK